MDGFPDRTNPYGPLGERMNDMWARGIRFARRVALAFGLSLALSIGVAGAVADNALVQILIIGLASIGFWLPMLFLIVGIESLFTRRRRKPAAEMTVEATATEAAPTHWQRLLAIAPSERDRVNAIRRSLDTSRSTLGGDSLDPDSHDLCVLIDRRLPQLIDKQLDSLPPDDRGRKQQIAELVDLVEQFARHCSRKRDGQADASSYQAEVLRRRFEERLAENRLSSQ